MAHDAEEQTEVLSIGLIYDWSPRGGPWREAINDLMRKVVERRDGISSPLSLNVVFHVGGRLLVPDFQGVRTGTYSSGRELLMVQAAIGPEVVADETQRPPMEVLGLLAQAVEEAETWLQRRSPNSSLASLRALVADLQRA